MRRGQPLRARTGKDASRPTPFRSPLGLSTCGFLFTQNAVPYNAPTTPLQRPPPKAPPSLPRFPIVDAHGSLLELVCPCRNSSVESPSSIPLSIAEPSLNNIGRRQACLNRSVLADRFLILPHPAAAHLQCNNPLPSPLPHHA